MYRACRSSGRHPRYAGFANGSEAGIGFAGSFCAETISADATDAPARWPHTVILSFFEEARMACARVSAPREGVDGGRSGS